MPSTTNQQKAGGDLSPLAFALIKHPSTRDARAAIAYCNAHGIEPTPDAIGAAPIARRINSDRNNSEIRKNSENRRVPKSGISENSEIRLGMYERQLKRTERLEREFGTGLRSTGAPCPTWGNGMRSRLGVAPPNKSGPQSVQKTQPRQALCIMRQHEAQTKEIHPARQTMCQLGVA